MNITQSRFTARLLLGVLVSSYALACSIPLAAQAAAGCETDGSRVVARRWDALLKKVWELKQDCAHPEWPARSVADGSSVSGTLDATEFARARVAIAQPLLIHAGDAVKLWLQDQKVRIEMSGVAEQSARNGERVMVRITRQNGDEGLPVDRIAGTVRGAGDVEMER